VRDGGNQSPDTILQFGHILSRKGSEFTMATIAMCEYEKVYVKRTFTALEMEHQGKIICDPLTETGKSVLITEILIRINIHLWSFLKMNKGNHPCSVSSESEGGGGGVSG